jgi:RND family efflux transporter MFP subunit
VIRRLASRSHAAVAGAGAIGLAAAAIAFAMSGGAPDLSTATVERGTFVDAVQMRGEMKAARSVTIIAPAEAGELRIVRLVRNGALVKRGDVLVEFDGSTVARTLDEKQSELRGLDAELEKTRSETRAAEGTSATAYATAGYDVGRAELDYSARERISRAEGEQRGLKLDDAKHTLREAEEKLASDRVAGDAKLAGVSGRRAKSEFDLNKAQGQLHALTIEAPSDGVVALQRNWRAGNWMNPQDFKEGDRVWPGAVIAELPDVSSLFATGRVDEIERGRLAVGQTATVRIEALPDRELRGRISSISALAKADFTSWPPPRTFEVSVALDERDERLRPGMTAAIRIATETLDEALLVPTQAVFSENGVDVVYVVSGGSIERRPVVIDRRSPERIALREGVREGERVALERPPVEAAR